MSKDQAGNAYFEISGFKFKAPKTYWRDGQAIIAKVVSSGVVADDGTIDISLFSEESAIQQQEVVAKCLIKANGDSWATLDGGTLDMHMEEVVRAGLNPIAHFAQLYESAIEGLVGDFLGQGASESPQQSLEAKPGKKSEAQSSAGPLKKTLSKSRQTS